jgi:hypothetical protein
MPTLNAELRQEIEKAGGNPVWLEDPETNTAYVLLKAEEYDRLRPNLGSDNALTEQVPEGIRQSLEAFLRDLPKLLARKRLRGQWVVYHRSSQIGVARRPNRLLQECSKLGLRSDEIYLGLIEPHTQEPAEIEHSFFEFEEVEPVS